ncbi:50S ribosomal protein L27 [Candidatus Microgenomates bacterium]|nr:50S ribosomal protein L27 [Candidatus Microgenomates bacterium]
MAHTKSQKATRGNRDSKSKRRGVKMFGGQLVKTGNVIVRQSGSKFHAGDGVLQAKDFTLMALREGVVEFRIRRGDTYVYVCDPS